MFGTQEEKRYRYQLDLDTGFVYMLDSEHATLSDLLLSIGNNIWVDTKYEDYVIRWSSVVAVKFIKEIDEIERFLEIC